MSFITDYTNPLVKTSGREMFVAALYDTGKRLRCGGEAL
jgi:hypothetical protein